MAIVVQIASSKGDQEDEGQTNAVSRVPGSLYCPVQAVLDWLWGGHVDRSERGTPHQGSRAVVRARLRALCWP